MQQDFVSEAMLNPDRKNDKLRNFADALYMFTTDLCHVKHTPSSTLNTDFLLGDTAKYLWSAVVEMLLLTAVCYTCESST